MWITDPRKIKGYFNTNFDLMESSNGWSNMDCPFCGKEGKMAINFHYAHAKCWVCGYSEHAIKFISDYEGVDISTSKKKLKSSSSLNIHKLNKAHSKEVSSVDLPNGYKSISEASGTLSERARRYLIGRGFDIDQLDLMGFGFSDDSESDYFGCIIIPFKSHGKLVYYIGRDFLGSYFRYINPSKENVGVGKGDVIFNSDSLDINSKVYITEGWSDALTMGFNGISSQGWSLSYTQVNRILNSSCDELVFLPDSGGDGRDSFYSKALNTALQFIDHKKVKVLDLELLNKGNDVNEIGKKNILKLEEGTDYLGFEDIVKIKLK